MDSENAARLIRLRANEVLVSAVRKGRDIGPLLAELNAKLDRANV